MTVRQGARPGEGMYGCKTHLFIYHNIYLETSQKAGLILNVHNSHSEFGL